MRRPLKFFKKNQSRPDLSAFYYRRILDALEKLDLDLAANTEGLDSEIAIVRIKIRSLLRNDADFQTAAQALTVLARLLALRNNLSEKSGTKIQDAVMNILKDIAVPLGVVSLSKKL